MMNLLCDTIEYKKHCSNDVHTGRNAVDKRVNNWCTSLRQKIWKRLPFHITFMLLKQEAIWKKRNAERNKQKQNSRWALQKPDTL